MTVACGVIGMLIAAGSVQVCTAQELPSQNTFSTAQKAIHALYEAIQSNDKPAISAILGAPAKVVCSTDAGLDKSERQQFVQKYQEMRRLVQESDGSTVLYIGAENWPFPFPLVSVKGAWRFDTDAGVHEILFRRIGENENAAIQECRDLVQANGPHEVEQVTGKTLMYGYHFQRIGGNSLHRDGPQAVSSAAPIGKSLFVAYPAEYRSSGVMTFIVTQDGVVYAKDLGPKASKRPSSLSGHTPDATWTVEK
jgi:hypothetical protein